MSTETGIENGDVVYKKYYDVEFAFNKDLSQLYDVKDGKLTIRRGTYSSTANSELGYALLDAPEFNSEGYAYNESQDVIDSSDIYVSAGQINTKNSLLVKQGYFEFKASLPSDGHSFMSWWMMGNPTGGNNNAYATSLYSKVYKHNQYYDGTSNTLKSNDPSTYRYQLPNSYYEIDIIELVQDITNLPSGNVYKSNNYDSDNKILNRSSWLTGLYDYELDFNIHKYFNTGLVDGKYYTINWSTYTGQDNYSAGTGYAANGSENHQDGILSSTLGSHDFGNSKVTGYTRSGSIWSSNNYNAMTYNADAHKLLTKERKYGFEWNVTTDAYGVGQSFNFTIYIYDADGKGTTKSYSFIDITYNESDSLSELDAALSNAEVANQYLFFLIDNIYYTSNQYHTSGETTLFTDLLDYNNADKTTLEIEYLRVYQAEGRKDIVTPDTEAFNNGNHFGY